MDSTQFLEIVKREWEGLNEQESVYFAYRCVVRALPFLGSTGSFDFWGNHVRQQYLLAVFRAIDAAAANDAKPGSGYAILVNAAARAAKDANADKATSVAYAANAAALIDSNSTYAITAASFAVSAAADAACMRQTIVDDLKAYKAGQQPTIDLEDYVSVWPQFRKALVDVGCAYWEELYRTIFENNFQQSEEELLKRLNVPEEIRQQGAAAVGNYLEALERGEAKRLNEARIIILGDKGAGKTCLARRLVDASAEMTTEEESTAGVDTLDWTIESEDGNINVSIWDFAGHTVTHAAHRFFLSERCLYILVHNGRTENNERLTYWLDHMKNYGGDSRAIIFVNKRDENRVNVPIHNLKEQYAIEDLYAFSVKDDLDELHAFREAIADYIRTNPSWSNEIIPESYYLVKEELEQLFKKSKQEKPQEHIAKDEFVKIAKRHEVQDVEQLLKDLHFLGVSLWYDEIEAFDSLVLNPEWISHGVYRIINWVSNHEKSGINKKEFKEVFKDELDRYPTGETHDFLFELLKHYELAYQTTHGQRLIIPHLLKEDRPAELPHFEVGESLKLQYRAEQPLPPHTISRFIVRHHEQIRKSSEVWRYGVVLKDGKGSVALVREERWTISVSVKGPSRTDFIDELRATLNDIFASYKSERPTLEYRIKEYGELKWSPGGLHKSQELFLSEKSILNHLRNNRPYYDHQTDEDIPLGTTAYSYKLDPAYSWHVFISHASEDKESVAEPLARALQQHGIQVWLDKDQLLAGDRLKDRLTKGVSKSRYGIVIFSKHYFQKKWPQEELAALLSRENRSETAIIPILHGVTMDDIKAQELLMADRVALSMTDGLDSVVEAIRKVLGRG